MESRVHEGVARSFNKEETYIEIRLQLAKKLKKHRLQCHITQVELAKAVQSSQSRVAKMESGDPAVSVDLLIRTLLALGATHRELAKLIAGKGASRAA